MKTHRKHVPGMKEQWHYLGMRIALGLSPEIDDQPCYHFRFEYDNGTKATELIIPRDKYWAPYIKVIDE